MKKSKHCPMPNCWKEPRANLYLNHGRAKHSDSCWRCDEPWPCDVIAALIDADHDWALWHDKWTAALDIAANRSAEVSRLTAEVERLTEWHREHGVTLVALAAANERVEKLEKDLDACNMELHSEI